MAQCPRAVLHERIEDKREVAGVDIADLPDRRSRKNVRRTEETRRNDYFAKENRSEKYGSSSQIEDEREAIFTGRRTSGTDQAIRDLPKVHRPRSHRMSQC